MALFLATPRSEAKPTSVDQSWWTSLLVLCAILGALFGLSFRTQNTIRSKELPSSTYSGLAQAYQILQDRVRGDFSTIGALQLNVARLENALGAHPGPQQVLEEDLKSVRFQAGLTAVKGPGVIVTLNDSKRPPQGAPNDVLMEYVIHDTDINQVVNELKGAGAEAISVNDQRLVAMSPIRCAGPTVFVNNVMETPPFQIQAIGDPKNLYGAMYMPGGVVAGYSNDPAMISVTKSDSLMLLAYQGPTQSKFARPANASRSGSE